MTALLGRRGGGAPDAFAEPPDPDSLQLEAVLLASEDRDISPEAIALAGKIAERSKAPVHVLVIARIWGTSFGFPNPGLMPNKREWDEQRKKAELAVRALKDWGLEADGHVLGTRNAAKKIVEMAHVQRLRRDRDDRRRAPRAPRGQHDLVAGAISGSKAGEHPRLSCDRILNAADDFAEFLSHQPPFDAVEEDERRAAAQAAELVKVSAGSTVLVEDGEPSQGMYVVYTGAMDLVHEDQVVDTLEPGECFGHPSLLSGRAPAFTVTAHEDSEAVFIPREPALRILGHPAGSAFVASSLRERLVRSGDTAHALPDLSLMRLSTLVDREPLILEPETSVREAARTMTDEGRPAALVRLADGMGMVTDADLRELGLAAGRSPDDPVRTVAQTEPLSAPGRPHRRRGARRPARGSSPRHLRHRSQRSRSWASSVSRTWPAESTRRSRCAASCRRHRTWTRWWRP